MAAVMHSMSYSLLLADRAHAFTRDHLNGKGPKVTSKAEAEESQRAKAKVRTLFSGRCVI